MFCTLYSAFGYFEFSWGFLFVLNFKFFSGLRTNKSYVTPNDSRKIVVGQLLHELEGNFICYFIASEFAVLKQEYYSIHLNNPFKELVMIKRQCLLITFIT